MPFWRRGRAEVIRETLVQVLHPVVDDDLLAVEVRVTEGRRGIDHRAGLEVVHRPMSTKAWSCAIIAKPESRVPRADQHGLVAVVIAAGLEGDQDELLLRQPAELSLS